MKRGKDSIARAGISVGPGLGYPRAVSRSTSRTTAMFSISRQVTERAALDFLIDAVGDMLVPAAGAEVSRHLFVPIIILPAVEPLGQPAALRQGQLLNSSLDFFHRAHGQILTVMAPSFKRDPTLGGVLV